MRTIVPPRRLLGTWTALLVLLGSGAAAARAGGPAEEAVRVDAPAADRHASTSTSTTTTAEPTTTTSTTVAVQTTLPPTTVAPTTVPPTTAPPVTEPPTTAPPLADPTPTGFEIVLGPEVYEPTGTPYVHLAGTGCTGPGHTNGVPYTYPFEYGVSYDFTRLDGTYVIRMDPVHSQPGTGDWTLDFPTVEGPGEFLVSVTCIDAGSEITPSGWTSPVLEYPAQRFSVPG